MYRPGLEIIRWASNGSRVRRRSALIVFAAEGEIRDEVAVHHVEVDPVGAFALGAADRVGEVPEVGVEDARGDARPRSRRLVVRRRRLAPHRVDPGGHGLLAAVAVQRPALAASRRCAPPRDRGRGGAPARSAASWPHAAPISWPRLRRIVTGMPAALRTSAKCSMTGIGLARQGVWATGFIGIRLTCARSPRRRFASAVGVEVRVVHAVDHRDLVADRAGPVSLRVVARRGHDLGHRPAPVEGHEHVAQRVAGRVDADRERELRPERGQPADAGHHARRRHRDVPRAEVQPARVVQRGHGLEHAIEVEQRLAHAHEHDVREPRAVLAPQPPDRAPDLVEDLGRRRGRARSRARRSRRTGSRRRSRPGSRCTACAARAGRVAPGSASAPTRWSRRRSAGGAPSRSGRRRRERARHRPASSIGGRHRAPRRARRQGRDVAAAVRTPRSTARPGSVAPGRPAGRDRRASVRGLGDRGPTGRAGGRRPMACWRPRQDSRRRLRRRHVAVRVERAPHAQPAHRQIAHPDAGRRCHGVHDRRGPGDHRRLADALRPERPLGRRHLDARGRRAARRPPTRGIA